MDRRQVLLAQQGEPGQAEEGVEHIRHISRTVRDSTILLVLRLPDEVRELLAVDPVRAVDGHERRQDPPAVADIRRLLGPAVEAAAGRLPLAEPPTKPVQVHDVQCANQRQGLDGAERVGRMGLRPGHWSEGAVVVVASEDPLRQSIHVDEIQRVQDGQRRHCAIGEASVHLPPLVAGEGPIWTLEAGDEAGDALSVQPVHGIVQ
mmetsp:Transcript_97540/g.272923  ORF Transcript_97540/g.272923 Transcript_97540/m.272923 type:complete len:205 (-) Transcript_97540:1-615(-)